jgi:hypothetical protein
MKLCKERLRIISPFAAQGVEIAVNAKFEAFFPFHQAVT